MELATGGSRRCRMGATASKGEERGDEGVGVAQNGYPKFFSFSVEGRRPGGRRNPKLVPTQFFSVSVGGRRPGCNLCSRWRTRPPFSLIGGQGRICPWIRQWSWPCDFPTPAFRPPWDGKHCGLCSWVWSTTTPLRSTPLKRAKIRAPTLI